MFYLTVVFLFQFLSFHFYLKHYQQGSHRGQENKIQELFKDFQGLLTLIFKN